MTWGVAKQQHNARYQFSEATIRYGFHPRCGETVIVTGRNRRGDEATLTVRQPDGTLAQMPIWMTEDRAAAMRVREIPRLPFALRARKNPRRSDRAGSRFTPCCKLSTLCPRMSSGIAAQNNYSSRITIIRDVSSHTTQGISMPALARVCVLAHAGTKNCISANGAVRRRLT